MKLLKVKKISDDCWGRARVQNIENKNIYADVDGVWYGTSRDGEPCCPLKNRIKIIKR